MEILISASEVVGRTEEPFGTTEALIGILEKMQKAHEQYVSIMSAAINETKEMNEVEQQKAGVVGLFMSGLNNYNTATGVVVDTLRDGTISTLRRKTSQLKEQYANIKRTHEKDVAVLVKSFKSVESLRDKAMADWDALYQHVKDVSNTQPTVTTVVEDTEISFGDSSVTRTRLQSNTTNAGIGDSIKHIFSRGGRSRSSVSQSGSQSSYGRLDELRADCSKSFGAYEFSLDAFNVELDKFLSVQFVQQVESLRHLETAHRQAVSNALAEVTGLQGSLAGISLASKEKVFEHVRLAPQHQRSNSEHVKLNEQRLTAMLPPDQPRKASYDLPCTAKEMESERWRTHLTLADEKYKKTRETVSKAEQKERTLMMERREANVEKTAAFRKKFKQKAKFGHLYEDDNENGLLKQYVLKLVVDENDTKSNGKVKAQRIDESGMVVPQVYTLASEDVSLLKVRDKNISLTHFIQYKRGAFHFLAFLTKEFNEENLLFWTEVRMFRSFFNGTQSEHEDLSLDQLLRLCSSIYKRFIGPDAPHMINVNSQQKSDVKTFIDSLPTEVPGDEDSEEAKELRSGMATVYTSCHEEIFRLLMSDPFPRFKQSPYFSEFLDDAKTLKL